MLWQYIGLVFSFAFRRTTIAIDSLQILAASAIPALAELAGIKMAPDISTETLAYIGAVGVVWIALRLIFAPFFIWREQVETIAELKLELSRPERIELARIRKLRAKNRLKLASTLSEIYFEQSRLTASNADGFVQIGIKFTKAVNLAAASVPSRDMNRVLIRYYDYSEDHMLRPSEEKRKVVASLMHDIVEYLTGHTTIETLVSQLPPSIESKRQP